ncbi:hypothetical protein KCU77_g8436, partial [Aureobasidium melanogenum]
MPLWPFGRKKRRLSASTAATTTSTSPTAATTPAPTAASPPTTTTTRQPAQQQQQQQTQARPADVSDIPAQAIARPPNDSSTHIITPNVLERQGSVQHDLTALPELSELEQSPHLRPANVIKPVHPYTLDRPSSARSRSQTLALPASHDKQAPGRRLSNKRKKDQTLREEEIRQMSAPMQIPKRPAANSGHDLLRRDSKKARRTLTKRPADDSRSSNVSLPLPESIHSNRSHMSEQRAWEIGGMSILNPRPTVRVSGTFTSPPSP